jgi:hypothetical protein
LLNFELLPAWVGLAAWAAALHFAAVLVGLQQPDQYGGRWMSLLYGLLSLVVAIPATTYVVLWFGRPAQPSESWPRLSKLFSNPPTPSRPPISAADALLPPFPTGRRGYDRDEVDAFFGSIGSLTQRELDAVRFRTRRGGYRLEDVDRAIDGWLQAKGVATTEVSPQLRETAMMRSASSLKRWLQS